MRKIWTGKKVKRETTDFEKPDARPMRAHTVANV